MSSKLQPDGWYHYRRSVVVTETSDRQTASDYIRVELDIGLIVAQQWTKAGTWSKSVTVMTSSIESKLPGREQSDKVAVYVDWLNVGLWSLRPRTVMVTRTCDDGNTPLALATVNCACQYNVNCHTDTLSQHILKIMEARCVWIPNFMQIGPYLAKL